MNQAAPLLQIENLTVAYRYGDRWLEAIKDVSLQIQPGQTYGLVGESGSGKTTLLMALLRYLGEDGRVLSGRILFDDRDLLQIPTAEMARLWGSQIALVPQNPLSSLNPSLRVGDQVAEILRRHEGLDRRTARDRVIHLLRLVRLPDPEGVAESYPHQISGGMQQRVLIAMAVTATPRLLVLDEPTTSLDVTTQASILDLFRDLIEGLGVSVLYVTHNLGVVAQFCDRVGVLYAGELVEDAPLDDLFSRPFHPYTRGLLDSVPALGQSKRVAPLQGIPGQIPTLGSRLEGCVFAPRCPLAIEICRERPPLYRPSKDRRSRCHRWEEMEQGNLNSGQGIGAKEQTIQPLPPVPYPLKAAPTLKLTDLSVRYNRRRSLRDVLSSRSARSVQAVERVSFALEHGLTVGLVGESGSGKSSLARAVAGLVEKSTGEMELAGMPLPARLSRRGLETLRRLQMVFQNPDEALNPYLTVGASLSRPLMTLLGFSRLQAEARARELLAAVRLPPEFDRRMPSQLSGGEKQRVAIARAFAANPDLLIADEAVSALDVSVQASVLNLLNELQASFGGSMLFISHDLAVVAYLADIVVVIYLGQVMEISRSETLLTPPWHPYTEALISAIPLPDPRARQERILLEGDPPNPTAASTGCPFHTRCPRFIGRICVEQTPPWQVDEDGARIFCHIPLEELKVGTVERWDPSTY